MTMPGPIIPQTHLTPAERVEADLGRIALLNPRFRAMVTPDPAGARAALAEAAVGSGALAGMTITVKDNIDTAGLRTACGSRLFADHIPGRDATVVARLRAAGAVVLGKAAMMELAFGLRTTDAIGGQCRNPWDDTCVPGGSSGGSAASVALDFGVASLGTDTGGSTRIPAAFNGIVGFKPTSPRVPTEGAFPLSYTLDSVGPMGRSVVECADMDAVLAGIEPTPLPTASLTGLRVGVPRGWLFSEMEPAVERAVEAAIDRLAKAGASIIEARFDDLFAAMREANALAPIGACEAAAIHAGALKDRRDRFDPRVRIRIEGGEHVPAAAYIRALRRREALKPHFAA